MNEESSNTVERTNGPKSIWVFTPSRTDPKDLEFILVQRQKLLQDAVERVRESALTDHKHHLLFVGPRGCGKTHLVTLIVSRLSEDDELADRLRIAWLNEDETCTTLLELLVKIHSALEKRYPDEYRENMLGEAYEMTQKAALEFVSEHLLSSLDSRNLLVVAENLDSIFEGLGDAGQKQLRAFIQENPRFSIVATAQRLVEDLSNRTSPFFGFFQTEHLKPLNVKEATELLQNIARLHGKSSVVEFLSTTRGRARVRALHHLSGGNHRIYIVLSQFITRDSIDALLGPFMKMVDELTPYYQERVRWLPPLQRKIIEYLCSREGTVPVKEIAKKLFATPQTISSQLQDLREKGYVEANQRGRESLYEISEPLMRICVEVKENQTHEPLRLLVDFLRVWYDDQELKRRLGKMEPASASCAYLESAIQRNSAEGNLRKQLFLEDFQFSLPEKWNATRRAGFIRELSNQPEGVLLAMESLSDGNKVEAMRCLNEALAQESTSFDKTGLLLFRAQLHSATGDRKALEDYTTVIEFNDTPVEHLARALVDRGVMQGEAGETQRAIDDFTAVIGLTGVPVELISMALINRGIGYGVAGEMQREIEDYTAVIGLAGAPIEQIASAFLYRGISHRHTGETQRAVDDYTAVIGLAGAPVEEVSKALINRGSMHGRAGETQRAIEDFSAVIGLAGAPVERVAKALYNRAFAHRKAGETQRAIEDYTAVIGLAGAPVEQVAEALISRGITQGKAGETQRAVEDFSAVIGLADAPVQQVADALYNRALAYGKAGEIQREIDDYTAVIGLAGASVEVVARALFNRAITHGQAGETQRAIEDYTAVIGLAGAPVEQVAKALTNRGLAHGESGETQREIDDYATAIGLAGAPVEQVAKALINRGLTHAKAGETQRAIEDYTAVIGLVGSPVAQVAKALISRGVAHGWAGEIQRAIEDYTAVIGLAGAPVEQIAISLINRGVTFFQQSRKRESQADFESLLRLPDAPTKTIVDSHLALSELHFSEGEWSKGFKALEAGLQRGAETQPPYYATANDLVSVIFSAGLNPGDRRNKVTELLRIYDTHRALPLLGEAIVQHIGNLFQRGKPFPSADNLEGWGSDWEHAAENVPGFRLSVRLLRTAVDFLKSAGTDRGILLELTSSERAIVEQAFGLGEKDHANG